MTSAKTPIRVRSQVLAGRAFQGLRGWQRPHRVWGPPAGVLAAVPHGSSRFRGCRRPHPAPTAGSPVSSPPETHVWSEAGGHDAPGDRGRASPPSGRGPHHSDPGAVRVRGEDTGGPWMSSVCPFPLGGRQPERGKKKREPLTPPSDPPKDSPFSAMLWGRQPLVGSAKSPPTYVGECQPRGGRDMNR